MIDSKKWLEEGRKMEKINNVRQDIESLLHEIHSERIQIQTIRKNEYGIPTHLSIELKKNDISKIKTQPYQPISNLRINLFLELRKLNRSTEICPDKTYLKHIKVRIELTNNDGKIKYFSFRIDSHDFTKSKETTFPHPLWHIQFNDRDLLLEDEKYGDIFFPDTPRFAHYPVDIVLAVDFILSHFIPEIWFSLREKKHHYKGVIRKYQNYYLKNYFEKIYKYWNGEKKDKDEAKKLVPHLL